MTRRARAVVVTVQNASRSAAVPTPADVRRWARAALADGMRGELTVRIVDERESADLNSRYRGKGVATNVLSFLANSAESPPAAGEELLPFGDVVICADVVEREAREQGKALAAHWAHMVVHGTLHLCGWDDTTDIDRNRMLDRQRELIAAFDDRAER